MTAPVKTLALLALLTLAACEQPTVDPDKAARDRILSTTWVSDDATYVGEPGLALHCNVDGTATLNAAPASWTYSAGVFTLTRAEGGVAVTYTTPSTLFAVSASSMVISFLGVTCHLKPL